MKYSIALCLLFFLSFSVEAQKKEIRSAAKENKKENFEAALNLLNSVESLLDAADAKTKNAFYEQRSFALFANGGSSKTNVDLAIAAIAQISECCNEEVKLLKQQILAHLVNSGSAAFDAKDLSTSSSYFESAYNFSKKDTLFLFYAASTAVNAKQYDRAIGMYENLRDLKYTGTQTQYLATNVETNKQDLFNFQAERDLRVKAKTHINPVDELSESKYPEIIKNLALLYIQEGQNDLALAAMADAKKENPGDVQLLLTEANIYFNMGNIEKFKETLEEATIMDPYNSELQFKLGMIARDAGDTDAAKAYYNQAIKLDPNYAPPHIEFAILILNNADLLNEDMNALVDSNRQSDWDKYDALKEKRNLLYRDAIPYLDKALEIESDNIQVHRQLSILYSTLGEEDKAKYHRDIFKSLEQ